MNSTERSTRVFAGIAAFLVVFSAPRLLLEMFDDSFPTVLLGLTALAAAWAVVCLVSLPAAGQAAGDAGPPSPGPAG